MPAIAGTELGGTKKVKINGVWYNGIVNVLDDNGNWVIASTMIYDGAVWGRTEE